MLTLSQAAKATGKSKSVISRAIEQDRLKAPKDDNGICQIDPVELFALFPEQKPEPAELPEQNRQNMRTEPERVPSQLQARITLLEEQLEHARENEAKLLHIVATSQKTAQLTHENSDERLAELRAERDAWKEQAQDWKTQASNQTLLLSQAQQRKRIFGLF